LEVADDILDFLRLGQLGELVVVAFAVLGGPVGEQFLHLHKDFVGASVAESLEGADVGLQELEDPVVLFGFPEFVACAGPPGFLDVLGLQVADLDGVLGLVAEEGHRLP